MADAKMRAPARTYPTMTAREIEGLIAEGRNIIVMDQYVLKVDAWMKYHPGGDKAIQHMVGRDATDEVNAFVPPHLMSCSQKGNHADTTVCQPTLSRSPRYDEQV